MARQKPELPEDDDRHDEPTAIVPLTYAAALNLRNLLQKAIDELNKVLS